MARLTSDAGSPLAARTTMYGFRPTYLRADPPVAHANQDVPANEGLLDRLASLPATHAPADTDLPRGPGHHHCDGGGTCHTTSGTEQYGVYVNDATREVLLCFPRSWPGTFGMPHMGIDTAEDRQAIKDLGIWHTYSKSDNARQALNALQAVKQEFPHHDVIISGYSLGGSMALYASSQEWSQNGDNSPLVATYAYSCYSGFGYSPLGFLGYFPNIEQFFYDALKDERMHCCFKRGDILSAAARIIADYYSPDVWIKGRFDGSWDQYWHPHLLGNYMPSEDEKERLEWTKLKSE